MPKVRRPSGLSQKNISSARNQKCSAAMTTTAVSASAPCTLSRLLEVRVQAVDVALHLLDAALVHDLAPHDLAGVSHAVTRWREGAFHVVHALAEHHLDRLRALAEHHDLDELAGVGVAHLDPFGIHRGDSRMRLN